MLVKCVTRIPEKTARNGIFEEAQDHFCFKVRLSQSAFRYGSYNFANYKKIFRGGQARMHSPPTSRESNKVTKNYMKTKTTLLLLYEKQNTTCFVLFKNRTPPVSDKKFGVPEMLLPGSKRLANCFPLDHKMRTLLSRENPEWSTRLTNCFRP